MPDNNADRFEASIARIQRKDSLRAEYARDDVMKRLDALKAAQAEAFEAIRAHVWHLAERSGASEAERRHSLDVIEQELGELCWSQRAELENEASELDRVIERADRPDAPIVL